jgi:uncharacterized membrane protein YagU involved in acid resistance
MERAAMNELLRGSIAGFVATAPMSLAMRAGEKLVPAHNKGHLPPRQVTESALRKLGLRKLLARDDRRTAALVAHYGFGASAGALLGVVATKASSVPRPVTGAAVGAAVWAASYLGWLPAANLRQNSNDEPAERNLQMISAHLVWGAVAGILLDAMNFDLERR